MNKQPIQPAYGSGVPLAPGAASATATVAKGNKQLILTNTGANICYVRVGPATVAAATVADYPVPAGAQVVVTKAQDDNTIAHISPLGTTLHAMGGEGF